MIQEDDAFDHLNLTHII